MEEARALSKSKYQLGFLSHYTFFRFESDILAEYDEAVSVNSAQSLSVPDLVNCSITQGPS